MARRRRKLDLNNCTLIELCYACTGGYLQAAKVVAYVISWSLVRKDLGRAPTKEEYAEFWNMNLRQVYYEQARFRKAFPALDDPELLVAAMERAGAGSGTEAFDVDGLVMA